MFLNVTTRLCTHITVIMFIMYDSNQRKVKSIKVLGVISHKLGRHCLSGNKIEHIYTVIQPTKSPDVFHSTPAFTLSTRRPDTSLKLSSQLPFWICLALLPPSLPCNILLCISCYVILCILFNIPTYSRYCDFN